jgi:hypothetical protein
VAPQAFVIDLTLAVKNGPAGMWRALSSPARIAPFGPLAWWVLPLAVALTALGAVVARRLVAARAASGARPPAGGGQLVDLDSRRRARQTRRGRRSPLR